LTGGSIDLYELNDAADVVEAQIERRDAHREVDIGRATPIVVEYLKLHEIAAAFRDGRRSIFLQETQPNPRITHQCEMQTPAL